MEAMGTIGGRAIVVKKYPASATMSVAGVFVLGGDQVSGDLQSMKVATTSTATTTPTLGVSLDTSGTIAATGTVEADLPVSIAVNPDLIIRAKMTNGATEDTALTIGECNTEDTTGVAAAGVATLKEGMLWGYDGGNVGSMRRADDTSGGVTVNFPNTISVGDRFLHANSFPGVATAAGLSNGPDLSTLITQADASTANPGNNDSFFLFGVQLGTTNDDGANNSFYHLVQNWSIFGNAGGTA